MRTTLILTVAAIFCAGVADRSFAAPPDPTLTIDVWPDKAPGETGQIGAERVRIVTAPALPQKAVSNVSKPQLEIFRPPKEKDIGVAIIICPGGGFGELKMDYEGEDCATWLNTIGVTGIVLKYRVPQRPNMPRYMAALQDTQRSISLVRSKAKELNIDPNRLGLLGFSAGAMVAVYAESNFDKPSYQAVDEIDKTSSRPDFAMIIYTGAISQDGKILPEIQISKQTPPTFITVADNDHSEESALLYLALKKAGISAEMHIYSDGVHGFGMRPSTEPHATWTNRLADWMNFHHYLSAQSTQPASN